MIFFRKVNEFDIKENKRLVNFQVNFKFLRICPVSCNQVKIWLIVSRVYSIAVLQCFTLE
jgi:hypothetical protein